MSCGGPFNEYTFIMVTRLEVKYDFAETETVKTAPYSFG